MKRISAPKTLRVVKPYLVIGAIALIWAVLILRTKFPSSHSEHENESGDRRALARSLPVSSFLFAVVAQFFYVGAQVGTWSYFITYVQEYAHQSEKIAGYFLTGTLAAFGVGRFASAWLMRVNCGRPSAWAPIVSPIVFWLRLRC